MKRVRQILDGPAEDRGSALVLVLIIVTVIGLAGAALLTFSDTSIRTTVALRDQAGNAYSADGAAQVAIDSLSKGYGFTPDLFDNTSGTSCFGPGPTDGTLNLPDFYPATSGNGTAPGSASVECSADPASGINAAVVPITGANRPGQAILTLGRSTEHGIYVKAEGSGGSSSFSVKGTVRSNSNIKVEDGKLESTAAVTAYGACSGSIVSVPAKSCNTATNLIDPNYASEATFGTPANAVPEYQPVPADVPASCPSGVVTFLPGYYDNAKQLTSLMSGSGPCSGSTWWFKPGTYYFDFHNNTRDSDVYRGPDTDSGGSADQWGIKKGQLVAGTPVNDSGNPIASPGATPTIPGSCQNPLRSTSAKGVQFIFGGDSQLSLEGSADAEICGTYKATRPPIGVFGLKSGTATTTVLTGPGTTATSALKMSTVVSPGLFTDPTRVTEQDDSSATWPKTTTTSQASTITVSGFAPPSDIPAGSIVKSAAIRVRHGNSKKYVSADRLAVTFKPKGVAGSPDGPAIAPTGLTYPDSTSLVTNSLGLQTAGSSSSTFAKYVHENGFTGADLAYAATLTHAGTESLDAMQIDITYVIPAFRSEDITTITSNCMRLPHPSEGSCAVLTTSDGSSFSGNLNIQGTTYTPLAAIDLTLNNATQQVMRAGVISRSFRVKETGSFSYAGPVIEIPDDSAGGDAEPVVFLTVFICPATTTSTCSTDPARIKALRVKARMSGSAPPSSINILGWSNLR
jgi:hypothetical protein